MITNQADLAVLKTELLTDPKSLGLTQVVDDDAENADLLNNVPPTPTTTMRVRVASIAAKDLFEACDPIELQALTDQQYRSFSTVISLGQIFPDTMPNTVEAITGFFGPASKSSAAISALLYRDGSRAEQMWQDKLLSEQYYITPSDVANARQLP